MIHGKFSDAPLKGSYALGVITAVNVDRHTVTIQPYTTIEDYKDVPLFRPPGVLSLPQEDDIAIMFINKRGQPIVLGFYPKFVNDALNEKAEYIIRPGDVSLRVPGSGQLLILGREGITRLVDRSDNGIEIIQGSGAVLTRGASKKDSFGGTTERAGLVRRAQVFNLGAGPEVSDSDTAEAVVRKVGSLVAPGTLTTTGDAGTPLHETKTTITVPGSETTEKPKGDPYYEETIGNVVEADALGTLTEPLHTDSNLPLRKKTVHYDTDGTTELIREEVDVKGNIHLYINGSEATTGIKLDAVVPLIAELLNLDITATNDIAMQSTSGKITADGTTVELNGNTDRIVLATKLLTYFNTHTHSGVTTGGGVTGVPVAPMTADNVASTTLKGT